MVRPGPGTVRRTILTLSRSDIYPLEGGDHYHLGGDIYPLGGRYLPSRRGGDAPPPTRGEDYDVVAFQQ
jgi:hypothetical protein